MTGEHDKIPNTYTVPGGGKEYLYVRVQAHGRTMRAPCTNEWLHRNGRKSIANVRKRAAAISAILRSALEQRVATGVRSDPKMRLDDAVADFLERQDRLPSSRRPSQGQRDRRRSVLLLGTQRRESFVRFLGNPRLSEVKSRDLEDFERELDVTARGIKSTCSPAKQGHPVEAVISD